ncbi:lytic transglycosylase domain-containing protein [Streptomyces sp. NPDC051018]|uniref:lytic transglycosylase domain-containing protein n=1 Tax=Streptomyces sp. NPDC051018 TaxID=3365639 RepID=UPI0037B1C600
MAAQFRRRFRRGATTTAVAAAAVAALSASQAPGITHAITIDGQGSLETSDATPPPGTPVSGNSPYYTDLPPLNTPAKADASTGLPVTGPSEAGIPATVLAAYKRAEQTIASSDPGCKVPWQLLAAIGKVESGQARGGKVDANGTTTSKILGPVLNGVGFANISDTDNGAYDGDTTYDRAVGPMQFIPSTWATWGQDGNGDGRKDPNNIYDAALAAGRYLCVGNRDLTVQADLDRAILGYNHSREYLRTVLSWFEYYKRGTHEVPDGTGALPDSETPDSSGGSSPSTPAPPSSPTSPATPPKQSDKPKDKPKPGNTTKPKPEPPTPPTTPVPVSRVENAGTGELSAVTGRQFSERVTVRVKNAMGRAVAGQKVRFEISGDTDTAFPGGKKTALLATGSDGRAVSPALKAGEKTGTFTVRVTAVGHQVPAAEFPARVTAPTADTLIRTDTKALTAAPGTEFADTVAVRATFGGDAAPGVAVTATLINPVQGDPAENDKGPHFKDADGKAIRTLTDLRTGADGALRLPKLFADDRTGTFTLRLTAAGGATLTVELKVIATPAPTESATPAS